MVQQQQQQLLAACNTATATIQPVNTCWRHHNIMPGSAQHNMSQRCWGTLLGYTCWVKYILHSGAVLASQVWSLEWSVKELVKKSAIDTAR
jgi:hypothetical protein